MLHQNLALLCLLSSWYKDGSSATACCLQEELPCRRLDELALHRLLLVPALADYHHALLATSGDATSVDTIARHHSVGDHTLHCLPLGWVALHLGS